MKHHIASVAFLLLSSVVSFSTYAPTRLRRRHAVTTAWLVPPSSRVADTRLHYSDVELSDHVVVDNDVVKNAISAGFHNKDFTSEEMVWELGSLLPSDTKLEIRRIGKIGRIEVIFPPDASDKTMSKLVFTTFLDSDSLEDMKTSIKRHYGPANYNDY